LSHLKNQYRKSFLLKSPPIILRGIKLTTNSACFPRISMKFALSFFIPDEIFLSKPPKSTVRRRSLSNFGTSSTNLIVPTRMSIFSRSSRVITGLVAAIAKNIVFRLIVTCLDYRSFTIALSRLINHKHKTRLITLANPFRTSPLRRSKFNF
jgi:hypothetical protein